MAGILAVFVAGLYGRLLFTNRVLANGDILLYFYPYRNYVSAALRSGHVPFWNPYIFLGAPLLANPQAAVLYPLHWPLIWLPVTQQIYWSAAIHTWIFGYGGYWLLRRWHCGAWAGLLAALVLAGSGLAGALVGHINQLNAAAWLPWAVLCLEAAAGGADPTLRVRAIWPRTLGAGIGLGVLVALMLLAGHTQTVYINLFALGIWAIWPLLAGLSRWVVGRVRRQQLTPGALQWTETILRLLVYTGGLVLGALLSGAQLLPTWELSQLGLRSGGLTFLEATSFSLKPLLLPWTLLPTYGLAELNAIFDTPAYTEYVAYTGLIGLGLALLGAWKGRGRARTFGLLMGILGLALGLGRWNPLYFLLYRFVPGFDLFRVPARWMLLYVLGIGVLAGSGTEWLTQRLLSAPGAQSWRRRSWLAPGLLALLLAGELLLAARALPHTQPTAPQAVYDLRTAPAHLLTDPARAEVDPAAAGRFLGMSTITYDPGDMADYQRIFLNSQPPQLDASAFHDLVIAQKVQELLAPNLSLLWRIPAVDGYDGGVLPLQRYNQLISLLIPRDQLVPDGRVREQIKEVPSADLLGMLNVQYLITDKVKDLWFDDVYYDRQIGARLDRAHPQVAVDAPEPFSATHLDLIGYVELDPAARAQLAAAGRPALTVSIRSSDGITQTYTITAGGAAGAGLADGALDSAMAKTAGAAVALRDVDAGRQEYRVRLALPAPITPVAVELHSVDPAIVPVVKALTLFDARTQMFTPLLPSDRGRFRRVHSGDVKIYENLDTQPRAYLVADVQPATDPQQASALLSAPDFPLGHAAVVEGSAPLAAEGVFSGTAQITRYAPEQVEIKTNSSQPALLVLSDAVYPGWTARVDGTPRPIFPTNVLFRGVHVPAGAHTVRFDFQPTYWAPGLLLSAIGLLATVIGGAVWIGWRIRRPRTRAV